MSTRGQAEGIDHGTPKGYRQHKRRRVTVCRPCQAVYDTDQEAGAEDRSAEHVWNGGLLAKKASPASTTTTSRELTAQERRGGARLLASRAADADELRGLLALAGLTAADGLADLEPP